MTNPMPGSIKALVGILGAFALLIAFAALNARDGSIMLWILASFHAFLVVGLIGGKEGARRLMITLCILNAGCQLLFAVMLMTAPSEPGIGGPIISMLAGFGFNVFGVWTLTRPNVQRWMFTRSTGIEAEEVIEP